MDQPSSRTQRFLNEALPHLDLLRRVALCRVRNAAAAEDLVQEVCLIAWRSFEQFEEGTNCRAWLMRILIHSLHSYRRRQLPWLLSSSDSGLILSRGGKLHTTPFDPFLQSTIDHLPPHLRSVIQLIDIQGFTYHEVARLLRIPSGTVMSRLSRARKRLRSLLSPQFSA